MLTCTAQANSIGSEGARALGDALQHNTSLTKLRYIARWKECEECITRMTHPQRAAFKTMLSMSRVLPRWARR